MRLSSWFLLGASLISATAAQDEDDTTRENTYFNGVKVPPALDLTPDNFEKTVSSTKWIFIKHYR